jgi:hypothetical protein
MQEMIVDEWLSIFVSVFESGLDIRGFRGSYL